MAIRNQEALWFTGVEVGRMGAKPWVNLVLVILLLPLLSQSVIADSGASLSMAGSRGATFVGDPPHVGDSVDLSVLVHNDGDIVGNAYMVAIIGGVETLGPIIEIGPGSSREVSTSLNPITNGSLGVEWSIQSNDSVIGTNLSGNSTLLVSPAQELTLTEPLYTWTVEDGLRVTFETTLDSGRNRSVLLVVDGTKSSQSIQLQQHALMLSPGSRMHELVLGSPDISGLQIEARPDGWSAPQPAFVSASLSTPVIDASITVNGATPSLPSAGDAVLIGVKVDNTGTDVIADARLRLIDAATGYVLADQILADMNGGTSNDFDVSISPWPSGNPVVIRAVITTEDIAVESTLSIESAVTVEDVAGVEIPWIPIGVGIVIGLILSFAARSAFKERNPSIGANKPSKRAVTEKNVLDDGRKREVECPECNRSLLIPWNYDGRARCAPPCSTEFTVPAPPIENAVEEAIKEVSSESDVLVHDDIELIKKHEPEKLFSLSTTDLLDCPSCSQTLKAGLDLRPVFIRCPVCKTEFEARRG
ncbi:MAG: hypothetical protein DBX05_03875 [Candidatus Poseidoniales archaeon]|nr:MAG: hypothetical protein DBX05_03875 [Candidatus Poseidoniales archaeon]